MPDSKRLQIQKALTTELEKITKANGYTHNITVARGRMVLDDNDLANVPLISIVEAPKEDTINYPDTGNAQKNGWQLLLSGWVVPDPLNPTDAAHDLLREAKLALSPIRLSLAPHEMQGNTVYMLNGLITSLDIGGGICRPPDERSYGHSFFLLPITLTFVENMESP